MIIISGLLQVSQDEKMSLDEMCSEYDTVDISVKVFNKISSTDFKV